MINIKCYYKNGDTVITKVNGTIEEAKQYFLNQYFNIGNTEDNIQKCIKVEEI